MQCMCINICWPRKPIGFCMHEKNENETKWRFSNEFIYYVSRKHSFNAVLDFDLRLHERRFFIFCFVNWFFIFTWPPNDSIRCAFWAHIFFFVSLDKEVAFKLQSMSKSQLRKQMVKTCYGNVFLGFTHTMCSINLFVWFILHAHLAQRICVSTIYKPIFMVFGIRFIFFDEKPSSDLNSWPNFESDQFIWPSFHQICIVPFPFVRIFDSVCDICIWFWFNDTVAATKHSKMLNHSSFFLSTSEKKPNWKPKINIYDDCVLYGAFGRSLSCVIYGLSYASRLSSVVSTFCSIRVLKLRYNRQSAGIVQARFSPFIIHIQQRSGCKIERME